MWNEKHVSLQKFVSIYLEWRLIWIMSGPRLKYTPPIIM